MQLIPIAYEKLNSRQKENYNFAKVSAVLADYGFTTMRLTDDWQGADFIAQHINGETFLKVQLKGRLSFDKKYVGKDIYISFFNEPDWYLYPHDEVLQKVQSRFEHTESWTKQGGYHYSNLSQDLTDILNRYKIVNSPALEAETIIDSSGRLTILWQEVSEIRGGECGHGVLFIDKGDTDESDESVTASGRLVGFVNGFEWYHGRSNEVTIYCIKPDSLTTEAVLSEMKQHVEAILFKREIPNWSGKIANRIASWVNG